MFHPILYSSCRIEKGGMESANSLQVNPATTSQGRIQDLIRGGAPDCDRPKTAILGPQFCRILVLGPHFWWSGGAGPLGPPPGSAPASQRNLIFDLLLSFRNTFVLDNTRFSLTILLLNVSLNNYSEFV